MPGTFYGYGVRSRDPNVHKPISLNQDKIVIGAYGEDVAAQDSGAVYVYDLSSATPNAPTLILNNPTPADVDNFGRSVTILGDQVLVGAVNDNTQAPFKELPTYSMSLPICLLR